MPGPVWFARILFIFALLIVGQALVRNWLLSRRSRWGWDTDAQVRPSDGEAAFHQAEFSALWSGVAEIVRAAGANFQYALVGSAAVFTWIATSGRVKDQEPLLPLNPDLLRLTVWLPFLLSAFFFAFSSALYIRMTEITRYLRRLEDALGSKSLGWEKEYVRHPHTISPLYVYGWFCLLAGDWYLAVHLSQAAH
jgi:hypothetical protein